MGHFAPLKYLFILFFLLLFWSCKTEKLPHAVGGFIQLDNNFLKKGIELKGEWEYLDGIKNSNDFTSSLAPFFNLPEHGTNGTFFRGISATGASTFRLRVFLPNTQTKWGIRTSQIYTAHKVYVNGKLIIDAGKTSETAENAEEEVRPHYGFFTNPSKNSAIEIILQVSNFNYYFGGIGKVPLLASAKFLEHRKKIEYSLDTVIITISLMMALLHFGFYLVYKDEKNNFSYGLLFLYLSESILFTNLGTRSLIDFFQKIPHFIFSTMDTLNLMLLPGMILFGHSTITGQKHFHKTMKYFWIVGLLLFIFSFFFTDYTGFHILEIAFIIVMISIVLVLRNSIMSKDSVFTKKIPVIIIATLSAIILFSNLAASLGYTDITYLTYFGILIVLASLSINSIFRLGNSFKEVARLSTQLQVTNRDLEQLIEERTEELNSYVRSIKRDLDLAQKIQANIMPVETDFDDLKLYLRFKPLDEVSGDIYDFYSLREGAIRIIIADATGHGLQAGLMTVAIKSEIESLKQMEEHCTQSFLRALNHGIATKFNGMFFTVAIFDVDIHANLVTYAMAGHPPQALIRQDGEVIKLLARGLLAGIDPEFQYFSGQTLFGKGDRLVLFSDGLFEQYNSKKEPYGLDQLFLSIEKNAGLVMKEFEKELFFDLEVFMANQKYHDDMTLMIIEP